MLDMSVVCICKSDIVSYITLHTIRSLFGYNLLVILLLLSLILFFFDKFPISFWNTVQNAFSYSICCLKNSNWFQKPSIL